MLLYCQYSLTQSPFAVGVRGSWTWCLKVTCGFGLLPVLEVLQEAEGKVGALRGTMKLVSGHCRMGVPGERLVVYATGPVLPPQPQLFSVLSLLHYHLLWKEVGSWVLCYFNHLMTLCPVQYQFVKVSGALHKIKSFDTLHPSSKCNKNSLADLSQWHSAGVSRGCMTQCSGNAHKDNSFLLYGIVR